MPPVGSPKIVRVGGELLDAALGDEEVVLDAQSPAALPVRARLDREHHPFLDRAAAGLVCIGRLVCAGSDAVRDRVRRLTGIAGVGDAVADQHVELREARSRAAVVERLAVDLEQRVEQLIVTRFELAWADVLRVVAPVAVRAYPDLEERRLSLLHRPVSRRGEGTDPRARPDEGEAECELDPVLPSRALAVDVAFPQSRSLALLHSGT